MDTRYRLEQLYIKGGWRQAEEFRSQRAAAAYYFFLWENSEKTSVVVSSHPRHLPDLVRTTEIGIWGPSVWGVGRLPLLNPGVDNISG